MSRRVDLSKKKTFVLDTNVLLFDPLAILKFGANDIVIPITVIEEVDRFKKDLNENGRNARQVSRFLDEMRRKGNLLEGVTLDSKGTLYVDLPDEKPIGLPAAFESNKPDNIILATALKHKNIDPRKPIIFVTKDTNLRIKADLLGIKAVDYEPGDQKVEELYAGMRYVDCNKKDIDDFFKEKKLALTGLKGVTDILPNEYVILRDLEDKAHTALGRYDLVSKNIVPLLRRNDILANKIVPSKGRMCFIL